jgi:DHA1 family bicyclomycin/chloramphenicol resistance-like MFS transporter
LLFIGLVLIAMCAKYRETLPAEKRTTEGLASAYASFFKVLRIKKYVMYLLTSGFAYGVLFGYIASAPFVMQEHYGVSELLFSVFFAINSVAIGIGSGVALRFKKMGNAGMVGALGMLLFALVQMGGYLFVDHIAMYLVSVFLVLLCMGLVFTAASAESMDAGREYTGAAAAIYGALGFFAGGAVSPLVGIGNMMHSMSLCLIISSALCALCMTLARRS